jgi:hypothetical protein
MIKNKPYDKKKNISSLGSDLTTVIQDFHNSGETMNKTKGDKKNN